jgi:cytochrome c551
MKHQLKRFMKPLSFVLIPAAVLAGLAGCSSSPPSESAALSGPADVVEMYKKNNCVSCHGTSLQGRMGEETNLQKVGARMTKEQIERQISEGGGGMPAFHSKLSKEEISRLADWLAAKK